ncbi:MAG TPA: polyprenyl synthetase family protein [Dehalococcoidales bacterium]|nr:polyprenyl synthetase family protein [Dehalococcoidales bacterium]
MELNGIYRSIKDDLSQVKESLRSIIKVDFPWLSEQLEYVVGSGGKGIRPALTLLSGKFYQYNLKYLMPMAVSVELMHTATLIHDDAIDKSMARRGRATIFKLWGEEPAILLGDYLFAKAGEFVSDTQNPRVIKLFSQTLATISSGELNQFFSAHNLQQTREQYFKKIFGKTASLFSLATESGAILSGAPEKSVKILRDYGHYLGIAFQVVDDILDFIGTEEELGKPVGSDLAQGTLTLPAMLLLERYPEDNPVKRLFANRNDQGNIKEAIELIRNSPIVDECYAVASEYCTQACQNINQLPANSSRDALLQLAEYVVARKR